MQASRRDSQAGPPDAASLIQPGAEPDASELEVLRQMGRHWRSALGQGAEQLRALPLDPALDTFHQAPAPSQFERLAPVEMFKSEAPNELVATESAALPGSRPGRAFATLRRAILGPPLQSAAIVQERMRKIVALPVLGSDLLSSVAYGPEVMLSVLVLAGSAALGLSLPLAGALLVLMVVAGLSYRQTIPAYPQGAGSYVVAGDNLGRLVGLAAAAGLMIDYVLTVSVSVASGVDAIASALPRARPIAVLLGLAVIALLLAGNLRGVRQADNLFAAPTYAFLLAIALLIGIGLAHLAQRGFSVTPLPPVTAVESLGLLLVLRAFASGATSMTGIEAVSNAIPAFKPTEWRNARITLTAMVAALIVMFVGLVLLIRFEGIVPLGDQTVLSQLGHRVFGAGGFYGYLQVTTTLILLMAANTPFNDFPRLLFFMARDEYAPRMFRRMGDRLTFSNGITTLAVTAAVIFAAFQGRTESLIPLYAVGVFLAFTLSQTGMVVRWWRRRGPHWRKSIAFNGLGAVMSAVVLLIAAITKFMEGAWVVCIGIPLLILLCARIHHHYETVRAALALHPLPGLAVHKDIIPSSLRPQLAEPYTEDMEHEESPEEIRHLAVLPIAQLDLAALRALAYAASLGQPLLAVHISPYEADAEQFRRQWDAWGGHVPMEIIFSPYRALVAPVVHYLKALHAERSDVIITVVLQEIVVKHHWHTLLHTHTGERLRHALRPIPGIVVTTIPVHLKQ